MFDLHTPELRAKLLQRREPYWMPIQRGCALGYRRGATGGTWIVRWRDPEGRKRYRSLGEADDEGCPGGALAETGIAAISRNPRRL